MLNLITQSLSHLCVFWGKIIPSSLENDPLFADETRG